MKLVKGGYARLFTKMGWLLVRVSKITLRRVYVDRSLCVKSGKTKDGGFVKNEDILAIHSCEAVHIKEMKDARPDWFHEYIDNDDITTEFWYVGDLQCKPVDNKPVWEDEVLFKLMSSDNSLPNMRVFSIVDRNGVSSTMINNQIRNVRYANRFDHEEESEELTNDQIRSICGIPHVESIEKGWFDIIKDLKWKIKLATPTPHEATLQVPNSLLNPMEMVDCTLGHSIEGCESRRPPIGITPKKFVQEERLKNINDAIDRYNEAGVDIPKAWIDERLSLVNSLVDFDGLVDLKESKKIEETVKDPYTCKDLLGDLLEFHEGIALGVRRHSLQKAADPLIQWLNDPANKVNPYHSVLVTGTSVELKSDEIGLHKIYDHVRD